ncbi:hypothetical protein [Rubrivirga marina]|uniref:hypothetical protein n=1 Tax=Rubrivirga marina TaxID=1196024 RepID=UPI00117A11C6|nr:hypothetical protein [Rubrivirga marina]
MNDMFDLESFYDLEEYSLSHKLIYVDYYETVDYCICRFVKTGHMNKKQKLKWEVYERNDITLLEVMAGDNCEISDQEIRNNTIYADVRYDRPNNFEGKTICSYRLRYRMDGIDCEAYGGHPKEVVRCREGDTRISIDILSRNPPPIIRFP